jgi:predicted ATPase/DNA-binding SARP family transcriptional activator/Tfp pilus assembly protein PilF
LILPILRHKTVKKPPGFNSLFNNREHRMSALRIKCMGEFQIELDGKPLASFETEKTRALLVYLALESGRPLRRPHLAGLLWSEESEERALHNLRQTLSFLRKALGPASAQFILADREAIQLNPDAPVWVDAKAFSQALACAYRHYQSSQGRGWWNVRCLQRAIDLVQGQFLEQFYLGKCALFEEWVALTREDYNQQAIQALGMLADYHEKRGEVHLALQTAIRIAKLAPWDESARAQVIYLLGMDQQWSAAQNQYAALRQYLQQEFGLLPSAELDALHEEIRNAAARKQPLPPRLSPAKHHLPEPLTAFIGRQAELDEIMQWVVAPENRLITLLGPGGVGKTRFALEIGRQLVGVPADGVFFISLLNAQNPGQIYPLIAQALNLSFSEQSEPHKQLLDHLRHKQLLLILDNMEHLLAEANIAQLLDAILRKAPGVTLLVTSRERLNLEQEKLYPLAGLKYPLDEHLPIQQAAGFDALNLFIQRTKQLQPDFVLQTDKLPVVMHICRILEGFPLGVELAAAAVWQHGYASIAERIENDLDVLTTSTSNMHPRHRSLRAAFNVSWTLLTPEEQNALRRLAVFRGGFTFSAARQVAEADAPALAALRSKSLLRQDIQDRYHMHEAIRQFVLEQLGSSGELKDIQARHASYYGSFLTEQNTDLLGPGQTTALDAIQQEFGNAGQAWDWLTAHQHAEEIKTCMDSLFQFFSVRSLFSEGITWFQKALNSLQDVPHAELILGMLLWRLGTLAYLAREDRLVFPSLLRSQQILLVCDAPQELADCRIHLGWAYQREKDFASAEACAEQSLTYFQNAQDALGESQALLLLGSIHDRQGHGRESKAFFLQALEKGRQSGNQRQQMLILNRLGDLSCVEGQYETAIKQFSECLEISRQLNDRYNQAILLNNLGTIHHIWQDYPQAEMHYQKSLRICEEIGDQDGIALALNNLGELATMQGDYGAAIRYSENALQIAEELQENWTIVVCLNSLGEIYCAMGDLEKSKDYLWQAIRQALEIQGMDLVARVSVNAGRILQLLGDQPAAIAVLQAALAHSATEHDAREKAMGFLAEMQTGNATQADDRLLEAVIRKELDI